MFTIENPVASTPIVERAQVLLQYLTDEAYRFYLRPNGAVIRAAGAYPKTNPSEYAHHDADELQEILKGSEGIRQLVSTPSNLRFSLHLVNVTDEGDVVFAKEVLGALNNDAEQISARL